MHGDKLCTKSTYTLGNCLGGDGLLAALDGLDEGANAVLALDLEDALLEGLELGELRREDIALEVELRVLLGGERELDGLGELGRVRGRERDPGRVGRLLGRALLRREADGRVRVDDVRAELVALVVVLLDLGEGLKCQLTIPECELTSSSDTRSAQNSLPASSFTA